MRHLKIAVILILALNLVLSCSESHMPKDTHLEVIYSDTQFVMGVDLSYVNAILDVGSEYRTSNAIVNNPYQIFKELGSNLVRVRLWHTPTWQVPLYGQIKYHNLIDVKNTIKQAKSYGMSTLLDLHYSDNWADPHKQDTPKSWQNLSLTILADSFYLYTYNVLKELAKDNLIPKYIQIGNENNTGICHPQGRINGNNFNNFCTLLQEGIQAVRDFSVEENEKIKVIIHVAQFQDAEGWVKGIQSCTIDLDYDILGISHYYKWSEYDKMDQISRAIEKLKTLTQKDIWIVETAFPWTLENKDTYPNILSDEGIPEGYSVTKSGQNLYLQELTQAIIAGGGKGIIYWEPAWISSPLKDQWGTGSSWENSTFFDFQNRVHNTIQYMKHKYRF